MFKKPFEAVIFDLDGVLVDTRLLHFSSWEKVFNEYLITKKTESLFTFEDYLSHVDGKPRREGISDFLKSRGLVDEAPVIDELADKKNKIFHEILDADLPEVFPNTIPAIERLKLYNISVAVVSSSANGRFILEKLNLSHHFSVIIDGHLGKNLNLKGKPAPDYFLEASKRLGLSPDQCCVVEDALAGIKAAKQGNFRMIYGLERIGESLSLALYNAGSDMVISSLTQIGSVPNALLCWDKIQWSFNNKDVALFLDFDGTLTDIAATPDSVMFSNTTKKILQLCSQSMKVAIISGRDRLNVKSIVGLDHVFYAGCHGFDISGPGCFHFSVDSIENSLKSLETATLLFESKLSGFSGVIIERKKFGTAVHYRLADQKKHDLIIEDLKTILHSFPDLKAKDGKKVFEIIPNVEWGKASAINKLTEILNIDKSKTILIFIGDDKTDEEAFVELDDSCLKIRIDQSGHAFTNADYHLKDPFEVMVFLTRILQSHAGKLKRWTLGA